MLCQYQRLLGKDHKEAVWVNSSGYNNNTLTQISAHNGKVLLGNNDTKYIILNGKHNEAVTVRSEGDLDLNSTKSGHGIRLGRNGDKNKYIDLKHTATVWDDKLELKKDKKFCIDGQCINKAAIDKLKDVLAAASFKNRSDYEN